MAADTVFLSLPANAVLALPAEQRGPQYEAIFSAPQPIREALFNPRTGAYVRGLAAAHRLLPEHAPRLSFVILRLLTGQLSARSLPETLAAEVPIAAEAARSLAAEIEADILAPLAASVPPAAVHPRPVAPTQPGQRAVPSNVLNLKRPAGPPVAPPPMPPAPRRSFDELS